MLDGAPDALFAAVRPYVTDSIGLGKILPYNCPRDLEAVRREEALVALQSDEAIKALYQRRK